MYYTFRMCRNKNAVEMVPRRRMRLDLLEVSKGFERVDFRTRELISVEISGKRASIYPDGRVLLFDTDEEEAGRLAPKIFKAIKKHSLKNEKLGGNPLFVGRFQPFHMGHFKVIRDILKEHGRITIIIGGPSKEGHTVKDPFSFGEREEMIRRSLEKAGIRDYTIFTFKDVRDDEKWSEGIKKLGDFGVAYTRNPWTERCLKMAGIDVREQKNYERYKHCGTKIRERIIQGKKWKDLVPEAVFEYIREVSGEERIRKLGS